MLLFSWEKAKMMRRRRYSATVPLSLIHIYAVEEVIRKLVKNPKFEEAILNKIGSRIDTEEIEKEIEGLEKQHRQLTGAKARLCLLYTSRCV